LIDINCPKCKSPMEKIQFQSFEVDRCTSCKGLWFDMLEHEKFKVLEGSEIIDSGDPSVGEKYNEIDKIDCPECRTPMVRMVDLNQPHIWFEKCSRCFGTFFGAGEFRDFKEESLIGLIEDLVGRARQ